jgi:hypothetical protein
VKKKCFGCLYFVRTCGTLERPRSKTLFTYGEGWFPILLARNFPIHTEGKWFSKMFVLWVCLELIEWEETDNKTYPSKRGKREEDFTRLEVRTRGRISPNWSCHAEHSRCSSDERDFSCNSSKHSIEPFPAPGHLEQA